MKVQFGTSVVKKVVMETAWEYVKNEGMSRKEAIKKAWSEVKACTLQNMLRERNEVKFFFYKKDGSIREALGTLLAVPFQFTPKGVAKNLSEAVVRYFDLEKMSWRSMSKGSLISIEAA